MKTGIDLTSKRTRTFFVLKVTIPNDLEDSSRVVTYTEIKQNDISSTPTEETSVNLRAAVNMSSTTEVDYVTKLLRQGINPAQLLIDELMEKQRVVRAKRAELIRKEMQRTAIANRYKRKRNYIHID